MKTIMKIGLGIVFGFVLLAGGCAALVGGAMSASDTDDTTFAERKAEERKAEASSTKTKAATAKKSEKPETQLTPGQENAIAKAEMYLDTQAFSRTGLIGQLEFEGFSTKDATFGVDQLKINWNEQAAAKAEQYLDTQPFSRDGLIDQLKFEGFSPEQAAYGVKQAGL